MADRPYILLSCGMSIDGYLDSASEQRLMLSNDADLDRVDEVRAGCDAILVGAATVRNDNPRLVVRDRRRQRRSGSPAGCRPRRPRSPSPATRSSTRAPASSAPAATRSSSTARPARSTEARERLGQVATVIDGGQPVEMARMSEDLYARGVRRLMVEGGGTDPHPVPHRRAGRRAPPRHRAVLRRRLAGPAVRRGRPLPVAPGPARRAGRRTPDRRRRAAALRALATIRVGLKGGHDDAAGHAARRSAPS